MVEAEEEGPLRRARQRCHPPPSPTERTILLHEGRQRGQRKLQSLARMDAIDRSIAALEQEYCELDVRFIWARGQLSGGGVGM